MRRLQIPLVLVVALCLAGVSVPAQQPSAPDFSGIEAVIRKEMQETHTPGAAIAIVMGDRVVYTRGFGLASVETGEAVRPEMLFRLGSTTKMITAAAVVYMAEQGRLGLHEPVSKYVPQLDKKLGSLTVHQLLSHTSGMFDEAPMFGSHDDKAMQDVLPLWTDGRMFFAGPGQVYSYSNPGYWLAGLAAATVGGNPFADQVRSTILAPLGMTRSTFRPMEAMTYPLAQGHDLVSGAPKIIRPAANNAASWPAGSLYSNVIDLSRWMIAFVHEGVVDGVRTDTWRGLDMVEHTGSRSGYGSNIRMVPSRKMGVVVLANRTGVSLPRTTDAAIAAALGPLPPIPTSAPISPSPHPSAEALGAYVGTYSQGARTMSVVNRDGHLFLFDGTSETVMEHVDTDTFRVGATRYMFVMNTSVAVTFLHTGGRSWRKTK